MVSPCRQPPRPAMRKIVPGSAFSVSNIFDRQARSKCLTAAVPLLRLLVLLQAEAVRRPQRRCGQRAVEMGMEPPGQIAARIAAARVRASA